MSIGDLPEKEEAGKSASDPRLDSGMFAAFSAEETQLPSGFVHFPRFQSTIVISEHFSN